MSTPSSVPEFSDSSRLVGVYNANGSVLGELSYVIGKLRGTTHCSLCDISHGRSVRQRKEWSTAIRKLPLPLETVHLNEMDTATARVADGVSPVVVYLDGDHDRILLTPADLDSCAGRVDEFLELVTNRLAETP
ncbi:hypothetical protein M0E87_04995 [Corynebacterium sp. CCM 9185]|uniref:GTPase n=1 Tax=Corynebacterium marambiense TaxID=2765364 RepID=A0ABS0VVB5_9CORY|nr:hypothetical protein [Corynebacterium marambiense]MBI9000715.1 hypothetical protein [Corynebacterium marambiense]MCK7663022.1 hypothetical protein [Corynebacterium marambiense]